MQMSLFPRGFVKCSCSEGKSSFVSFWGRFSSETLHRPSRAHCVFWSLCPAQHNRWSVLSEGSGWEHREFWCASVINYSEVSQLHLTLEGSLKPENTTIKTNTAASDDEQGSGTWESLRNEQNWQIWKALLISSVFDSASQACDSVRFRFHFDSFVYIYIYIYLSGTIHVKFSQGKKTLSTNPVYMWVTCESVGTTLL